LVLSLITSLVLVFIFSISEALNSAKRVNSLYGKRPIVNQSVVQIDNKCSGFIAQKNIVVTAAHCVEHTDMPIVQFYNYKIELFEVKFLGNMANGNDFAVLKGNTHDLPALQNHPKRPEFLTSIIHFGYNSSPAQWATPGKYIGVLCKNNECAHYIAARVVPGDSGGAVIIYGTNLVIGIAVESYWQYDVALSVIVPMEKIMPHLAPPDLE
jgi:hypothetical protein